LTAARVNADYCLLLQCPSLMLCGN